MESEITIELEQSFASVVRYIQNKADNKAALYFDDLPWQRSSQEDFLQGYL